MVIVRAHKNKPMNNKTTKKPLKTEQRLRLLTNRAQVFESIVGNSFEVPKLSVTDSFFIITRHKKAASSVRVHRLARARPHFSEFPG